MAKYVNCTAHDIILIHPYKVLFNMDKKCYMLAEKDTPFEEYCKAIIRPCRQVSRCTQERKYVNTDVIEPNEFTEIFAEPDEADVNNYITSYGKVSDLPEPQENTLFIVSALVANALKGIRVDVRIPSNMVKNEAGQPIGCLDFSLV